MTDTPKDETALETALRRLLAGSIDEWDLTGIPLLTRHKIAALAVAQSVQCAALAEYLHHRICHGHAIAKEEAQKTERKVRKAVGHIGLLR